MFIMAMAITATSMRMMSMVTIIIAITTRVANVRTPITATTRCTPRILNMGRTIGASRPGWQR
jgi:hypothetical protein